MLTRTLSVSIVIGLGLFVGGAATGVELSVKKLEGMTRRPNVQSETQRRGSPPPGTSVATRFGCAALGLGLTVLSTLGRLAMAREADRTAGRF